MGCQHYTPIEDGAGTFTVAMPRLTFGRGSLAEAGEHCATLGLRRIALFTDAALASSELLQTVTDSLREAGIAHATFCDIRIEPCDHTVANAAAFYADGQFDGALSLGGGSVIDTAKAALLTATQGGRTLDYIAAPTGGGKAADAPLPPHVACPTTAGTGSECTPISVIRIQELDTKFVVCSRHLLPQIAIVDPQCIDSLPPKVVASTGFDLLSHALECFTARGFTSYTHLPPVSSRLPIQGANPFSDLAAREAMKIAGDHLVPAVHDSTAEQSRDKMTWASTLAGIAFGNAGTHLPHAMSYGITHLMRDVTTGDYPVASPFVPHGISVIVTSPAVFRYTAEAAPQRHLEAARLLGASTGDATPAEAGELLANHLIQLMRDTDMPNGITGVGFSADDVSALAQSAARQKRAVANATRESNLIDLENMYRDALSYW